MKKLIGWPVAWVLFSVGRVMSVLSWPLYSFYNWLMLASCSVQDWAGLEGPWKDG
jgi:hypothetical protein